MNYVKNGSGRSGGKMTYHEANPKTKSRVNAVENASKELKEFYAGKELETKQLIYIVQQFINSTDPKSRSLATKTIMYIKKWIKSEKVSKCQTEKCIGLITDGNCTEGCGVDK